MRKNLKEKKEVVPPEWLVNLLIKERVWRWRMNERIKRWVIQELPWRLRFYFILFLLIGLLGCALALRDALRAQDDANAKLDSLYRRDMQNILTGCQDTTQTTPRLRHDAVLFWRLADSIDADSGLKRRVDSFLRNRPGLADSLQRVKDALPRVP